MRISSIEIASKLENKVISIASVGDVCPHFAFTGSLSTLHPHFLHCISHLFEDKSSAASEHVNSLETFNLRRTLSLLSEYNTEDEEPSESSNPLETFRHLLEKTITLNWKSNAKGTKDTLFDLFDISGKGYYQYSSSDRKTEITDPSSLKRDIFSILSSFHNSENSQQRMSNENLILAVSKFFEVLLETSSVEWHLDHENEQVDFKSNETYITSLNFFSFGQLYLSFIFFRLLSKYFSLNQEQKNLDSRNGLIVLNQVDCIQNVNALKRVIPLFTSLFEGCQFIISLNSPFMFQSLDGFVCFDFDYEHVLENPSKYTLTPILSNYFKAKQFSETMKNDLHELLSLSKTERRSLKKEQKARLKSLYQSYSDINQLLAPELKSVLSEVTLNLTINKHRL